MKNKIRRWLTQVTAAMAPFAPQQGKYLHRRRPISRVSLVIAKKKNISIPPKDQTVTTNFIRKGRKNMVIRLFRRHIILACVVILAAVIAVTMAVNFSHGQESTSENPAVVSATASGSTAKNSTPQSAASTASSAAAAMVPANSSKEMRAVWVPYLSLNMSNETDKSEQAFLKKFNAIVNTAKSCGMNALVVQVRPFGDALYPSSYFPWSHIVSGTQGSNPGYDPLKDMVAACHKSGLKIHAWVNPLRIQVSGSPSILAVNNPYYKFRSVSSKADYVGEFQNGSYYNPAYEEVRRLVADGVKEIAQKYDVDGIQFDDYFYPTQDASFDKKAYDTYCTEAKKAGTPLSLSDWRRANINALVSLVYREVKSVKSNLPFGIAPQGNAQNDMNMGADVYSWCSAKGYVDYICPQLYYNFQNPTLPFNRAADTWKNLVKNKEIKLYFGLAVYKAGSSADSGTWKSSSSILASQIQYGRDAACDGFMLYSCDYLTGSQTKQEVQNVIKLLN